MAAVAITRMDLGAAELRAEAGRAKAPAVARRLLALALALVLDGADRASAARQCGMERQTLPGRVRRCNAEGVAGLAGRKSKGRPPKLAAGQREELRQLVETGPDLAAGKVARRRCAGLERRIAETFKVEAHERTVGKLLNKLGYRRLSARPQHPCSDPAAQEAFEKTSPSSPAPPCPRPPPASRSRSGSRTRRASASRAR